MVPDRNIITDDGLIISSMSEPSTLFETGSLLTASCRPKGSIYQQVILNVEHLLKEDKDFPWIVHFLDDSKSIRSLKNIESKSKSYAKALELAGVTRGDVVCMMMGRSNTEVFFAGFGTWIHGGALFFGDIRAGAQALAHQLSDIECKFLICTEATLSVVQEAARVVSGSLNLILVTETKSGLKEFSLSRNGEDFQTVYSEENPSDNFPQPLDLDVDNEMAMVTFTSGTTGNPKPMVHTHTTEWNYLYGTLNDYMTQNSVTLATLKVDTSVGFICAIYLLVQVQNTMVIEFTEEKFEENIFAGMVEHQPTCLILYANHVVRLAEAEQLPQYSTKGILGSVKTILPAGAAIPLESERKLRENFPELTSVSSLYGTSEIGIIARTDTNHHIGYLMPLVEVKVVSPDDPSKILGPGEPGEILVRKPLMMKGYLNREEETRKFFDSDGFAHIGDIVKYDETGRIYYIERFKEMIKFNDFRVWPTIVEAELQKHPAVLECMIYGKPNPPTMELVSAAIVLKKGYTKEIKSDILQFLKDRMEDSNQIRGGITFCEKLPRNSMGKLLRREARANALFESCK